MVLKLHGRLKTSPDKAESFLVSGFVRTPCKKWRFAPNNACTNVVKYVLDLCVQPFISQAFLLWWNAWKVSVVLHPIALKHDWSAVLTSKLFSNCFGLSDALPGVGFHKNNYPRIGLFHTLKEVLFYWVLLEIFLFNYKCMIIRVQPKPHYCLST